MKNFYEILKNVCILAHEELPSDFSDTTDPYPEIKQYIKNTVEEVCSKFPFTFREKLYSFATESGKKEYSLPDGLLPQNILEDGVRINGSNLPLYFLFHEDIDIISQTSGKPYRYSFFGSKLILDPVPDNVYTIQVKYLTSNYAFDAAGVIEKSNLDLQNDLTIIPDRYIKVVEWGAYSLFRQNFKPDGKYQLAREKYLEALLDMSRQDGYGKDGSASFVIGHKIRSMRDNRILPDF